MKIFVKIVDKITSVAGAVAGVMLCITVILMITEVVLRSFFTKTLYVADEYSAFLMVGITFLGLAYALKEGSHIQMSLVHRFLTDKQRAILNIITLAIGFVLIAIIFVKTSQFFWTAVVYGGRSLNVSGTHLAIPKFFMPLGSMVFALQFLSEMFKNVIQIREGKYTKHKTELEELEELLDKELSVKPERGVVS